MWSAARIFPARGRFLRRVLWGAGPAAACVLAVGIPGLPCHQEARTGDLVLDPSNGQLSFQATLQAEAFLHSLPPDHQYHAVVSRGGSAAEKALFVTDVDDAEVAGALRALGARDGGGVPMAAWTQRWVPLVSAPTSRVVGSRVEVRVTWEGNGDGFTLDELLHDPGGKGIEMRFGGNEEHDHEWDSGCILCLFSCPGGVISNAAYSIRDHQRSVTAFEAGERLPPDGTEVTITLALAPG